ncbi:MAG: flagellar biosynthesis protein FlhA [Anaerolineales bacterium]|nr:flagellar biosynthesis protein FlhA [Anaerolineales bacterium]
MTAVSATPAFGWRALFGSRDVVLVVALLLIVGLMIVPLPPVALDLLVALNIALSIGIMLLAMYIPRPVDFNAFPSILLLVTLFRLGLNIATSRSILLNGDAGKVIATFGDFVVGGNYVVGIVVFLMLMVIQFLVITNGAGRVAEVAARFTLDAMPGKQLSIDADLNAGLIDETDARARRKAIQTEADFFGSMDGSSKFVRGDATAAIVIVVVNILGGFVIGIWQRGLDLMQALQLYTLLTVGAGLVIQIPSLLVSTATGLIVTRSASDNSLGSDVVKQLSNLNVLIIVAGLIGGLGLVPGFPPVPFLLVGGALGGAAYAVWRAGQKPAALAAPAASAAPALEGPEELAGLLVVDPLEIEIGYGLIPLVSEDRPENLLRRISSIRRQMATELGMMLPKVRIRDNLRLQPNAYRLKIRGEEVARGDVLLDRCLAIPGSDVGAEALPGIATTEPAFGLPAVWIPETERGRAEMLGYTVVDAITVVSTHLTEVIRAQAPTLLGRQEVQEMLDRLKQSSPAVVTGLVPDLLTLGEVQDVMRNLLRERVPIRDLAGILEVLANSARVTRDPDVLAEAVRQTFARTLSNQYRSEDGRLHVFTLAPQLEAVLKAALGPADRGLGFQIDAGLAQQLILRTGEQMERLAQTGYQPILLCPRELRLAYRRLVERSLPNLVVLAFSEISTGTQVQALGLVELPERG